MALTLETVAQQFDQWRSIKKHRAPIPSDLWDQVAQIAGQHSVFKITRRLGINYVQYNAHVTPRLGKQLALPEATAEAIQFVSVPPALSSAAPVVSAPMVLEFARCDGALVKCYCPEVGMMRDTLSWFLKGG